MIRREIVLPAPREEVWEALTEPERLDDEGEVELTLDDDADGTRLTVIESSPSWSTALGLQASALQASALAACV
jgi:hypothetical protein